MCPSENAIAKQLHTNCRTAVLFTRKAQAVKKPDTPVKEETVGVGGGQPPEAPAKAAKKSGRGKRNSNRRSVESGDGLNTSATSATATSTGGGGGGSGGLQLPGPAGLDRRGNSGVGDGVGQADTVVAAGSHRAMPDSFRVYRAQESRGMSDSEASQLTFTGSTCSSCSGFDDSDDGSGSDFG